MRTVHSGARMIDAVGFEVRLDLNPSVRHLLWLLHQSDGSRLERRRVGIQVEAEPEPYRLNPGRANLIDTFVRQMRKRSVAVVILYFPPIKCFQH